MIEGNEGLLAFWLASYGCFAEALADAEAYLASGRGQRRSQTQSDMLCAAA